MAINFRRSFLIVVLLAVSVTNVHSHGSSRLRLMIGEAGPGSSETRPMPVSGDPNLGLLACPAGQTLQLASLDAAQNPKCVSCGSNLQFCCQGIKCGKGLKCQTQGVVQPVCIRADSYKPRTAKATATGKRRGAAGAAATISVTKATGCGVAGWACCSDKSCDLGNVCKGSTCVPDTTTVTA